MNQRSMASQRKSDGLCRRIDLRVLELLDLHVDAVDLNAPSSAGSRTLELAANFGRLVLGCIDASRTDPGRIRDASGTHPELVPVPPSRLHAASCGPLSAHAAALGCSPAALRGRSQRGCARDVARMRKVLAAPCRKPREGSRIVPKFTSASLLAA